MGVTGLMLFIQLAAILLAGDAERIVAKVNGATITAGDLEFAALQQGIAADDRSKADEAKLLEHLIDRQLVRGFLESRKIEPTDDDLQFQIARAEELTKKRGDDPKLLLGKMGYTPERLKSELGLSVAWQSYVRKTVTPMQIREYFQRHKIEIDGTQFRARQVFLKLPKPASDQEVQEQLKKMTVIRREIETQKLHFADAAKKYSDAPTRDVGGDVGLFRWQGKLPAVVSQSAFALKSDEISEPIVSPFGVHLIQVTERHPGDFSLEDVRPVILDRLSQQMWNATIENERGTAKIERNLIK